MPWLIKQRYKHYVIALLAGRILRVSCLYFHGKCVHTKKIRKDNFYATLNTIHARNYCYKTHKIFSELLQRTEVEPKNTTISTCSLNLKQYLAN